MPAKSRSSFQVRISRIKSRNEKRGLSAPFPILSMVLYGQLLTDNKYHPIAVNTGGKIRKTPVKRVRKRRKEM